MITATNNNFWICDQVKSRSDQLFIKIENEELSYKSFFITSLEYSKFLINRGISKNDHVAVFSDNSIDFLLIVQSLWFLKAIPIPINTRLINQEVENLVKISKCKYIINCEQNKQHFYFADVIEIMHDRNKKEEVEFEDSLKFNRDAIALMLFTSGSTGTPKCVKLSFNNLYESSLSCDSFIDHSNEDIWIASLPFYHIGGFSIFTRTLLSGCKLIIPKSLKIPELTNSIIKFKPTLISLVPSMLEKVIDVFNKPWEGLRTAFIGGGPMNEGLLEKSLKMKWPISTVYGSTETSSMVTVASTNNLKSYGLSAGKPLKGIGIKFSGDEKLKKIAVSSKSVSKGYFNLDEKYERQIENGTYYSNDIGRFDENGNLKIYGRSDEVIISGGENISLAEIEKILNGLEELRTCVALGIKDEKWGQSYIIISDSQLENLEEMIISVLRENVGRFKYPSSIERIKSIPYNPLGKTLKNELKEKFNFNFL